MAVGFCGKDFPVSSAPAEEKYRRCGGKEAPTRPASQRSGAARLPPKPSEQFLFNCDLLPPLESCSSSGFNFLVWAFYFLRSVFLKVSFEERMTSSRSPSSSPPPFRKLPAKIGKSLKKMIVSFRISSAPSGVPAQGRAMGVLEPLKFESSPEKLKYIGIYTRLVCRASP